MCERLSHKELKKRKKNIRPVQLFLYITAAHKSLEGAADRYHKWGSVGVFVLLLLFCFLGGLGGTPALASF